MMQASAVLPSKNKHQKRVVIIVGSYVTLWLALWYLARMADVLGGASLWFLPAGLRFFSFVLFGWPALLLELAVVFVANLMQFVSSGLPAPGLLSTQTLWLVYDWLGLPIAYALVLFPVRQKMRERLDIALASHCALFVGVALAAASLGAIVGTVHLVYSGMIEQQQWGNVTASWFTGDFIGIITLTPLLLVRVWPRLVRYFGLWQWIDSPKSLPVAIGYRSGLYTALVTILSVLLVFGIPRYFDLNAQTPLVALLLLLPLVGVSLRYGLSGAVLAVALLDGGLVLSVVLLKQQYLTQQYQMVMVAIALVGLWLGGAVESRNRLLESYNKELLAEVGRQTLALQQANRELAIKEQHLQVVLTAAPVGVMEFDGSGYCSYLNNIAAALTDRTSERAIGRHVVDFIHPDDRDKMELAWNSHRQNTTVQTLEILLKNNLWCTAHWINLPLSESAGDGAVLVLTDSTVRRQQEDRLWTLGHHDSLTSLPNRKLFMDRCEQALSLAKRRDSVAAVLWIDLDGFKAVNDKLGHAAGDALLQQVAQRLKTRIRDSDTLARIGGDEFAVVMSDVQNSVAVALVANALVASLNDPFNLPQGVAHISCSIGVALYPEQALTVETLIQCADMAMYTAKHAGKNQVQISGDIRPGKRQTSGPDALA
jgi:diguanylate cyclase (GGDEF)-like protein/PAS domain S-box-containing protein